MSKSFVVPDLPQTDRPVSGAVVNGQQDLTKASGPTDLETGSERKYRADSVEEHMQMAARMVYDLIAEWRKHHAEEISKRTSEWERKRKGER